MPRRPRIHQPGGFYHVTLRGNHQRDIFFSTGDRALLNSIVAKAIDDLLTNAGVERLALGRHLVPPQQPLANRENRRKRRAFFRTDLLFARMEFLACERGADCFRRALQ